MKIKIINTGNRKIDSLLNQILKRAVKINKLKKAQKAGRAKRAAYEAKQVKSLMNKFPDEFKQAKRQYKTLRGATNYLAKYNASQATQENFNLVQDSLGEVRSIERITKRQAAGLPPLGTFQGNDFDKMLTNKMNELGIKQTKLRNKIRQSWLDSHQWERLPNTWRKNRDEARLEAFFEEGIKSAHFEPLNETKYFKKKGKYSMKSLRKNYYSKHLDQAMREYEDAIGKYIPNNKKAGWVRIYTSEAVQAEVDKLMKTQDPAKQRAIDGNRMRALSMVMHGSTEEFIEDFNLSDLVSP